MKISLVIRTFNEESNIRKCLSGVMGQSRLPDEVLIVDNCSSDQTIEIAREFEEELPLHVFCNHEVSYVSGLNLGAKEAKHDVVGFLSADCYPEPTWLENLVLTMENGRAEVVMGQEKVVGEDDIHYVLKRTKPLFHKDKVIKFFQNTNIIYKKESLRKLLPFVGVGEKRGGEDTILSIRYAREGHKAMKSAGAVVDHSVYDSMEDFVDRTRQQGARLIDFFLAGWRYPRTYLNPFYWSLIEFLYFFRFWDKRFLKIAGLRFWHILTGMIKL